MIVAMRGNVIASRYESAFDVQWNDWEGGRWGEWQMPRRTFVGGEWLPFSHSQTVPHW